MSVAARVAAQAKVNLLLRVLAREASGYHTIETVFLRLELSDDVEVRVGDGVRARTLDCVGDGVGMDSLGPVERNLAYRAAMAYGEATGWPPAFAVEVVKRIPIGGGLGGGSADAGAVLRALDALSPNPLGDRLPELGAALGADVPFMALDSPMALAWGRGERLLPLPVLASRWVALLVPPFGVPTADAYAWLSEGRPGFAVQGHVLQPTSLDTWAGVASVAVNDFEAVVARRHPEVASYVDALRTRGALVARMSGSGSAVFGVFAEEAAARAACDTLAGDGDVNAVVTRTADRVAPVRVD